MWVPARLVLLGRRLSAQVLCLPLSEHLPSPEITAPSAPTSLLPHSAPAGSPGQGRQSLPRLREKQRQWVSPKGVTVTDPMNSEGAALFRAQVCDYSVTTAHNFPMRHRKSGQRAGFFFFFFCMSLFSAGCGANGPSGRCQHPGPACRRVLLPGRSGGHLDKNLMAPPMCIT